MACKAEEKLRNGKIKFIFNREAKREMGLLLPGGPQAELQNLLEFIICWNKAASGNKLLVAVADGAGDTEPGITACHGALSLPG